MTANANSRLEKAVEEHRETLQAIAESDIDIQLVDDTQYLLDEFG